jgi:hypothetical protein
MLLIKNMINGLLQRSSFIAISGAQEAACAHWLYIKLEAMDAELCVRFRGMAT